MSALDTRTQETPSVKAGLWLRVNPKEGCEGKCEDPYLLPFFSDSKEYDPISRRLHVCVCVCARAHALLCVWLSDSARFVLWRHGDPQSRSVTFQDVGPVVPLLTVCLSLVLDFLKETMVSGLFCTPRA